MILITKSAAKKALFLAKKDGKYPLLRVGVKGGGCTGMSYHMDFDSNKREDDSILNIEGLTVVCDPKSLKFLEDTELDYDSNILSGGFKFRNPKAKQTCSCGDSFAL